MTRLGQILARAALACALALAVALLPDGAAQAAVEEGAPAAAAPALPAAPEGRTIPIAPIDPESTAGRIVHGIADKLEQWVGSGSKGLRLFLDAPMWAEERGDTVTVHLPGARLARHRKDKPELTFGDLALVVTPRSEVSYDFETALPAAVEGESDRLTIGESTLSGTWRADLETTTRLNLGATDIRASEGAAPGPPKLTLGHISVEDELVQGEDGLWSGRFSLGLSDLAVAGLSLGRLDVAGTFEDFEHDAILAMRRDFGLLTDEASGTEALEEALAPFLLTRWGRSEVTIALHRLSVAGDDWGLSRSGAFGLGQLDLQAEFDGRESLADIATRITAREPQLSGVNTGLPPGFMPHTVTVDLALKRLPLRRIAETLAALDAQGRLDDRDLGAMGDIPLAYMDAADTSLELRDIRVTAPVYDFRAEGRFNVEPAGIVGLVGHVDARIRGLGTLMDLAMERRNEGMIAAVLFLQGLGRPVFEEGSAEPVYTYELDLSRTGTITINGLPLDVLLKGGLSPP